MVYERLRAILAEQLGIAIDDINMALEDEFDLVVTDEAARELYTVREISEFIEKLI